MQRECIVIFIVSWLVVFPAFLMTYAHNIFLDMFDEMLWKMSWNLDQREISNFYQFTSFICLISLY